MSKITVVIPCYNEADRLKTSQFLAWVREVDVGLLFVDDGSTDNTLDLLEEMAAQSDGLVQCMFLDKNRGKAEAVRQGMVRAFSEGARSRRVLGRRFSHVTHGNRAHHRSLNGERAEHCHGGASCHHRSRHPTQRHAPLPRTCFCHFRFHWVERQFLRHPMRRKILQGHAPFVGGPRNAVQNQMGVRCRML